MAHSDTSPTSLGIVVGISIAWVCVPLRTDGITELVRDVVGPLRGNVCFASESWAVVDFDSDVVGADEAAAAVSGARATEAVVIAVADSDFARAALFSGGVVVDEVVAGLADEEERDPPQLDTAKWSALVPAGTTAAEVADIFNMENAAFAEESVAELCRLVGIDFEAVLHHCVAATSPRTAEPAATGGAQAQGVAGASPSEVGGRMRMSVTVRPTKNGDVSLSGPALASLIRLRSAVCGGIACDITTTPNSTVIKIPADSPAPDLSNVRARPEWLAEWRAQRTLDLEFDAIAPGSGTLTIRATAPAMSVDVTIEPQRPRPLRGAVVDGMYHPEWGMAEQLRHLAGGPYLTCRLTFGAPAEDAAPTAAAMVEWWLDSFPRPDAWRLFLSWEDDDHHISNLKATRRRPSATWKKLGPLVGVNVTGDVVEDPHAFLPPVQPGPGFAWTEHRPFASFWDTTLNGGSELVLWVQRPGDDDEAAGLVTALTQQVDQACVASSVMQAQVSSCGATPSALESLYETVTGVWGMVTVTPDWAGRWLREVAPVMWLGPSLLRGIDMPALAAVANITEINGHVRVNLPRDGVVGDLERACAAIVPSHEDWKNAVIEQQLHLPDWVEGARRD